MDFFIDLFDSGFSGMFLLLLFAVAVLVPWGLVRNTRRIRDRMDTPAARIIWTVLLVLAVLASFLFFQVLGIISAVAALLVPMRNRNRGQRRFFGITRLGNIDQEVIGLLKLVQNFQSSPYWRYRSDSVHIYPLFSPADSSMTLVVNVFLNVKDLALINFFSKNQSLTSLFHLVQGNNIYYYTATTTQAVHGDPTRVMTALATRLRQAFPDVEFSLDLDSEYRTARIEIKNGMAITPLAPAPTPEMTSVGSLEKITQELTELLYLVRDFQQDYFWESDSGLVRIFLVDANGKICLDPAASRWLKVEVMLYIDNRSTIEEHSRNLPLTGRFQLTQNGDNIFCYEATTQQMFPKTSAQAMDILVPRLRKAFPYADFQTREWITIDNGLGCSRL